MQDQGSTGVVPQYICVLSGDHKAQAVAELVTGLKLRICHDHGAMVAFFGEVNPQEVVLVFDAATAVGYPVRFFERAMRKVGERVPSHFLATGCSYFVEIGTLASRQTDRTKHVAHMLDAAFVKNFSERVTQGEYPWGKKPGTDRKANRPRKARQPRSQSWLSMHCHGLPRPYAAA